MASHSGNSPQGLVEALTNYKSLLALPGSKKIYISGAALIAGIQVTNVITGLLWKVKKRRDNAAFSSGGAVTLKDQHGKVIQRVAINSAFWKQLKTLLPIVLPSWKSKEGFLLFLHTLFLVARTFVSIYVAQLDGKIVKAIVDRRLKTFMYCMTLWLSVAIPATYINSMIRFLESKLSLAFRTRLTKHLYDKYMSNQIYYRVGNLDNRLANADQCLTEDVNKFCGMLAHLHSQLSKPTLDIVLNSFELWYLGMAKGKRPSDNLPPLFLAGLIVYITYKVMKLMTPPFGKMVAEQGRREGELRYTHSRLITHAEEIAFYGGHNVEKRALLNSYYSLVKYMNTIAKSRILHGMMEGFLMKYVWSATGLAMTALPIFFKKYGEEKTTDDASSRTEHFITARKLLADTAEATERLMGAYKEITELAGYTSRVHQLFTVFDDCKNEHFVKGTLNTEFPPGSGSVSISDYIKLEDVPIVTPNGDVLTRSLTFEIRRGMHLLISGPNGCGKSSLFRIVGGLWPICGGKVVKPDPKEIFYIPQRPYLSLGNLRDQVIYPDSAEHMRKKGVTDKDLDAIMEWVALTGIVEREGGWDAVADWQDVLSGGEKQRVGMARLFYHKPLFAFLDECTSAVSVDVEGKMYLHAIDIGVTLLTVTHRPSLWKYHNHILQFDGEGGWKFNELNAESRLSLKEEKTKLENELQNVPKRQKRLKELCLILGEDSTALKSHKDRSNSVELAI